MPENVDAPPPASPPDLIELRRDLHRHPELRFLEHRTAAIVETRLRAVGYAVRPGVGGTGVIAVQESGVPGTHVMLRADMDALAVVDRKDVPYRSEVAGVAHACGHDVHTVVALGVADLLAVRPIPRGRVSLVFQPAEERPFGEPSGAQAMLDDGVLDHAPDAILGLHCWPDLPVGSVGVDERIAMAGKDAFRIMFRGKGAHAATPSKGRDAILGVAQLVTALHQGFSRSRDAGDLAVLNVGTVHGGTSQSVLAEHAEVTGTLRAVDPAVRGRLRSELERIASGCAAMLALEMEFAWADEMPPIVNDPRLASRALSVIGSLLGVDAARSLPVPPMTSDDFALFAHLAPALYLKLGVSGGEPWPTLHSALFDVDERSIGVGIAVLEGLTRDLLERPLVAAIVRPVSPAKSRPSMEGGT